MRFTCFDDWHQLSKSSTRLFLVAEKKSLFFSNHWFENIVETALRDGDSVLFACVVDAENVLAVLPLIQRENKEWSSLCHSYSSLYSFLLSENDQPEILNCLSEGLKELPFDYLTVQPVAEDDANINQLQHVMKASGFSCHRNFRFYNWFHKTNARTFSNYMADRPSKVRNTIARKQRKLKREHGYEIRLYTQKDIEQALSDYHDIYKVSWKANEQHEAIVKGFTNKATKAGWTRLGILYTDGKPIAAHLWFVVHRKASIFRLVYDQNWKQYSPGSILMSYMMEHVIDSDKVEEIDFLTGNDRYKQDWMSERRERFELTFVKKTEPEIKEKLLTKMSRAVMKLTE